MGYSGKCNHSILGVPDQSTDFANLPASQCAFVSLGLKPKKICPKMGLLISSNGAGSPDFSRQVHNLTHSSGNINCTHWPDVGNSQAERKTFKNVT